MLRPTRRTRHQNTTPPATTAPATRRRGSTLLLVLAALLLSMLMGLAYMQVVRQDNASTANLVRTRDLEMVGYSIVQRIAEVLHDDLAIGDDNGFFKQDRGDGVESYDYPGDVDPWLAASAPENDGGTDKWRQVSTLNGGPRDLTANDDTNGTFRGSGEEADADGDGITDARPEDPPIQSLHGVDYRMWVRIIDNSALINLNVATSQVDSGGQYNEGDDAPRWWYPSELDLGGFVFSYAGVSARMTELDQLLNYRLGNTTLPTPWITRGDFWLNGAALYGNANTSYTFLGISSELELRYRNGSHHINVRSRLEHETDGMRYFLRQYDSSDTGNLQDPEGGGQKQYEFHYNDILANMNETENIPNYFAIEPRHQLTTISGHAIHAPRVDGETGPVRKVDINQTLDSDDDGNPDAAGATALSAEFANFFAVHTPTNFPNGVTSANEMADQLAANVTDYLDQDLDGNTRIAQVTTVGDRHGYERVPFITEIYVAMPYTIAANPPGSNTNRFLEAMQPGYAIEIRNPYKRPCLVKGVHVIVDGTDWGDLYDLIGNGAGLTDDMLPPDTSIVLYRVSEGGTDPTAFVSDSPITQDVSFDWPTKDNTPHGELDVSLAVDTSAGGSVTYQTAVGMKPHIEQANIGNPHNEDEVWTTESSYQGTGNGLNALTVTRGDFAGTEQRNWSRTPDGSVANLGQPTKSHGANGTQIDNETNQQFLFSQLQTMVHVGDLALIPILGPTANKTIADQWANATTLDAFRMRLDDASDGEVDLGDNGPVPYGVALLERFTTLSPYEDGQDNDGDGQSDDNDPEKDELFVPGTINLNTVARDTLLFALPIPEANNRETLVDNLMAYRNNNPKNLRNQEGFAYIGEVFDATANIFGNDGAQNHTNNGTGSGTYLDYLDNPLPDNSPDTVQDDIEEQAMPLRWLAQTCSVRSDIYTAYILVRGYQGGGEPISERRLVVVFDRSRIADRNDSVRVLALTWY